MTDRVSVALCASELELLTAESAVADVQEALQRFRAAVEPLDPLERQLARSGAVRLLSDLGIADARPLVAAALAGLNGHGNGNGSHSESQGQVVAFGDPDPWPEAVDGADLLERVRGFIDRFLGLPPGAGALLAAFAVYSYTVDAFAAATYIVVHSPAPQCGKTRVLEVLAALVRRPWLTIVPSTAVLFRVLEQSAPTLLLDEAEVVHGRGDAAGDVRALLQSGYRRGAFVPRCVGDANEVRTFRVFGPKVFALIGELPAALFDRCIPVEMQRRQRSERLARFRPSHVEAEALELRRQARRWAQDAKDRLAHVEVPSLPSLDERAEEVWEPILAVGLTAGGRWYDRLRQAAEHLSGGRSTPSAGVELLADIRTILTNRASDDRIASVDLAAALNELEGRPWADRNRGQGIRPNQVARLLADFGITSTSIRIGDRTPKGYLFERFADAFERYVSPSGAPGAATPPQPNGDGHDLANGESQHVAPLNHEIMAESGQCGGVAAEKQGGTDDRQYEALDPDADARAAMRGGA